MADYDQDQNPDSQRTETGGWRKWIHFAWIRTPIGLLKIAEFVVIILGLIIIASIDYAGSLSSIEFFIFVCTTSWVFVLVTIILNILNVYEKLPAIITSNVVMSISCGLGALMMLIASAAVMGKYSRNDKVLAAGAFGLIAMFFFIFETIYYLIQFRRNGAFSSTTGSAQTTSEQTFETEQPTGEY